MWFLRRLLGIEAKNDRDYIMALEDKIHEQAHKIIGLQDVVREKTNTLARITDRYK